MEQTASDIEILEHLVGGRMIKEMTAIEFMGWVAAKMNNATINPIIQELRVAVSAPPVTNNLAPEAKITIIRKMMEGGLSV